MEWRACAKYLSALSVFLSNFQDAVMYDWSIYCTCLADCAHADTGHYGIIFNCSKALFLPAQLSQATVHPHGMIKALARKGASTNHKPKEFPQQPYSTAYFAPKSPDTSHNRRGQLKVILATGAQRIQHKELCKLEQRAGSHSLAQCQSCCKAARAAVQQRHGYTQHCRAASVATPAELHSTCSRHTGLQERRCPLRDAARGHARPVKTAATYVSCAEALIVTRRTRPEAPRLQGS